MAQWFILAHRRAFESRNAPGVYVPGPASGSQSRRSAMCQYIGRACVRVSKGFLAISVSTLHVSTEADAQRCPLSDFSCIF